MTPDAIRLTRARRDDTALLEQMLRGADLTTSGLDASSVRLWIAWIGDDPVGTTGYEVADGGRDALIRSVCVVDGRRGSGLGLWLAQQAMDSAALEGAEHAWLFSRRSGRFWQRLGFSPAATDDLARALSDTHQVRLFRATGQLEREVAWSRPLSA